jgi:hypothetical protein
MFGNQRGEIFISGTVLLFVLGGMVLGALIWGQ